MKESKLDSLQSSTIDRGLINGKRMIASVRNALKTLKERIGFGDKIQRNAEELGSNENGSNIPPARRELIKRQLPKEAARAEFEKSDLIEQATTLVDEKMAEYAQRMQTIDEEIRHADELIAHLVETKGGISERLKQSRELLEERKKLFNELQKSRDELEQYRPKKYTEELPVDLYSDDIGAIEAVDYAETTLSNTRNFSDLVSYMKLLPGVMKDRFGKPHSVSELIDAINYERKIARTDGIPNDVQGFESFQLSAMPEYFTNNLLNLMRKDAQLYERLQKTYPGALVFAFNTRRRINFDYFSLYQPGHNEQMMSLNDFEKLAQQQYSKAGHADKFEFEWNAFLDRIMANM